VTSFFREKHHFDSLSKECEETLKDKAKSGQRVRIWSAGCSSGQEPYSIAMTLLDKISDAANLNVKILATDIDPKIIERARKGTYKPEDATGIPSHLASRFVSINDDASLSMHDTARKLITFAELNLISDWPFHGPFDVIFCRNVAIYFSPETQKELWKRFRDMLTPNGLLFIGHSERVSGPAATDLSPIGITTYRKTAKSPGNPQDRRAGWD
jgi:chemotaxis protein methyltransferase CheR